MLPTLIQIQSSLAEGRDTMQNIVSSYLSTIEQHQNLNAYVHVFKKEALERAEQLDNKIKNGETLGALYGAVISIKDNICMQGHPVSAASAILKNYISPYHSTVVERLLAADAIIIGSTNCDEFGMGSTSTNSTYGSVHNGEDDSLIAGGSSGGAAVSVQMNTCLLALGSDTGGSVRQPASLCNVIGFKPSYGMVSRHGLIAYASSFDQIGVMGKHLEDIASCLSVIAGPDEYDSTMAELPMQTSHEIKNKYAIIPAMFDAENMYTETIKNMAYSIVGATHIEEVNFDYMPYLIPCYYILTTAEASSNLSRYDGIRYGHRSEHSEDLQQLYINSRTEGFGAEVRKRIMLGTFVLSEGYYDAYYTKAQKIRRIITDQINAILDKYDAIIMPVTPSGAWPIDKKIEDPLEIYLSDVYTVLANITGMPAISIPVQKDGAMVNLQLLGKKGCDAALIAIAAKLSK